MSFTETEKHWLCGFALATAASRSDVNVAIPHLRGKWSPTKAIWRTFESSFMGSTLARRTGTVLINPSPSVAPDPANEEDLSGFAAPDSSRAETVAFS